MAKDWAAVPGSGRRLKQFCQGLETFFYGVIGGFEDAICLTIQGFPAAENAPEIAHRLAALRHGTAIALSEDAGHVFFRFGAEPDGEALT